MRLHAIQVFVSKVSHTCPRFTLKFDAVERLLLLQKYAFCAHWALVCFVTQKSHACQSNVLAQNS
jgi:hypothetical protein